MSSIFLAGLLTEMSRLKSPAIKMLCAFVSKARPPIESSIELRTAGEEFEGQ